MCTLSEYLARMEQVFLRFKTPEETVIALERLRKMEEAKLSKAAN